MAKSIIFRASVDLRNLHVAPYLELDEVLVAENIATINGTLEFLESISESLGRKEITLREIAEKDQLDCQLKLLKASREKKRQQRVAINMPPPLNPVKAPNEPKVAFQKRLKQFEADQWAYDAMLKEQNNAAEIEFSGPEPDQLDVDESHPRWTAFHENAKLHQAVKNLQQKFAALLARSLSEVEVLELQKDILCQKERLSQDAKILKQYSDAVDKRYKESSAELSTAIAKLEEEKEKARRFENARMINDAKKAKMANEKKHQKTYRNLLNIGQKQLEIEKEELRARQKENSQVLENAKNADLEIFKKAVAEIGDGLPTSSSTEVLNIKAKMLLKSELTLHTSAKQSRFNQAGDTSTSSPKP